MFISVIELHSDVFHCFNENSYIIIANSLYGHEENWLCNSKDVTAILSELCNGKKECKVLSSNDIYGDPCHGIKKFLYVKYFCKDHLEVHVTVLPRRKLIKKDKLYENYSLTDCVKLLDLYSIKKFQTISYTSKSKQCLLLKHRDFEESETMIDDVNCVSLLKNIIRIKKINC